MKAKITKRRVDLMKPGDLIADDEVKGFVVRCLDSGIITYGYRYRDKTTQRQRWLALGLHGSITADQARGLAKKRAGEVADYRDPAAEAESARAAAIKAKLAETNTVDAILDNFLDRYAKGLRSHGQMKRAFKVYVRPRIGHVSIYDLRRRNIVEMLDAIEDKNGPVMADRVLAYVRKAFNWHATRDDQFSPPIVKGMSRTKPAERARERILSDDEIRALWTALDDEQLPAAYSDIVRVLLFTGQRRSDVSNMHRSEIDGDVWMIPGERYKTGAAQFVPLTTDALAWIGERKGYIFSSTGGKKPFNGFSKAKRQLDAAITRGRKAAGLSALPNWTLHDLRRTGRSLMSRAGVSGDVAERVLGHVIPGVKGVYDRYSYEKEKRDALKRLAALLKTIINPPADNIIRLASK